MSALPTLLDRNQRFADERHQVLPPAPRFSLIVISCMDARTDPAHLFGLAPGDALVIRNAGGRVTPEVEKQLGVLIAIIQKAGFDMPELAVVHHTSCGMQRLAPPPVRAAIGEATGIEPELIDRLAIVDPEQSLRADLEALRASPWVPQGTLVTGLLWNHESGRADTTFAEVL